MDHRFFEQPVLNSPYEYPLRHWELDGSGQPTQRTIEKRRRADFITPIPKPKKRKGAIEQRDLVFEGHGIEDPLNLIVEIKVYQIQADFEAEVEARFNEMIDKTVPEGT